jgi:TrmH family RNA methyltransferase
MILTNDCSDIYNHKVIRATMGAIFRVQISYTNNIFKTIDDYKFLGFKSYASALRADSNNLNHVNFSNKILMVIGNEGQGLNQDVIDACDESIIIPMSESVDSLNAAVAASIIMWEMTNKH